MSIAPAYHRQQKAPSGLLAFSVLVLPVLSVLPCFRAAILRCRDDTVLRRHADDTGSSARTNVGPSGPSGSNIGVPTAYPLSQRAPTLERLACAPRRSFASVLGVSACVHQISKRPVAATVRAHACTRAAAGARAAVSYHGVPSFV